MLPVLVHHFLIAIQTQIVPLRHKIILRHTEALGRARAISLCAVALQPAGKHIGQVVLSVLVGAQCGLWDCPELVGGEQRGTLVVEAPAVGVDVVEPDVVGAAGVGPGEQKDGGGLVGGRPGP